MKQEKQLTKNDLLEALKPMHKELSKFSSFITKQDLLEALVPIYKELARFPTKQELHDELSRFATRQELHKELSQFVTKNDLLKEFAPIHKELSQLSKGIARLENKIDHVHKELEDDINRLAPFIAQGLEKIENHARRIGTLEEIVLV